MKKFVTVTSVMVLVLLLIKFGLLYFDVSLDGDTDVTYKSTTQFGIVYEVPYNYIESFMSTGDEYAYESRKGNFKLTVQQSEATGATVSQYVSYTTKLINTGSVVVNGVTASTSNNYSKNYKCTTSNVIDKNGIEMGNIVIEYDRDYKGKTTKITEQLYGIKINNTIVQFDFMTETKDVEKYQEIVDYIVNSIKKS